MERKFLAVAAAALALGSASAAAATFTLGLSGTGFQAISTGCGPGIDCLPPTPWYGTLSVTTDSDADTIYTAADLTLVELKTNLYSFSIDPATDTDCCDYFSIATISGRPSSMLISYNPTPFAEFNLEDLHAAFSVELNGPGGIAPYAGGSGTLFPVPEPASPLMMWVGLAVVGLGLRFRGASARLARSPARPTR